ncbi:unnamed protein product [Protopolystoma xenopodis]|uniref:Uncharacterized protein n=1 Tax=Protopolystoma xenopodis TaxID=117903 RepID=A0A3S5BJG0_9PLAT|nr:unnamed protein product [Protopolystoma xenopodis]
MLSGANTAILHGAVPLSVGATGFVSVSGPSASGGLCPPPPSSTPTPPPHMTPTPSSAVTFTPPQAVIRPPGGQAVFIDSILSQPSALSQQSQSQQQQSNPVGLSAPMTPSQKGQAALAASTGQLVNFISTPCMPPPVPSQSPGPVITSLSLAPMSAQSPGGVVFTSGTIGSGMGSTETNSSISLASSISSSPNGAGMTTTFSNSVPISLASRPAHPQFVQPVSHRLSMSGCVSSNSTVSGIPLISPILSSGMPCMPLQSTPPPQTLQSLVPHPPIPAQSPAPPSQPPLSAVSPGQSASSLAPQSISMVNMANGHLPTGGPPLVVINQITTSMASQISAPMQQSQQQQPMVSLSGSVTLTL